MIYGSLFTGIGGFDLGFDRAGMECAWQVEIDRRCRHILRRHWPGVPKFEDVRECGKRNLSSVDLVSFGFPCQDVSVAGTRDGLAGTRSGLFFEAVRILEELRPQLVLVENVAGILSSNGGRDMGTVLRTLGDLGYWWAYRCLDAQYYGLAQRRGRVFVVGSARARTDPVQVLFEPESVCWDPEPCRATRKNIAGALAGCSERSGPDVKQAQANHLVVAPEAVIAGTISTKPWHNSDGTMPGTLIVFDRTRATVSGEIAGPLRCNSAKKAGVNPGKADNQCVLIAAQKPLIAFDRARDGTTSPIAKPLRCNAARQYVFHSAGVRRLTPRECERLQGFPDDWTAWGVDEFGRRVDISDTQRYRMLGNAVAVPVAQWIGRRMKRVAGN